MIASCGAALLALLGTAEPVWRAEMQSQVRARNEPGSYVPGLNNPGDPTYAKLGETELRAALGLTATNSAGLVDLGYAPRFLLQQTFSGSAVETGSAVQQAGGLRLGTLLGPTTVLAWDTRAEWGRVDYSPLSGHAAPSSGPLGSVSGSPAPSSGAPAAGGVSLPAKRFVNSLAFESMLDLSQKFSPRLRLSARAGFRRTGGYGSVAAAILAPQMGPAASARLEWDADRTNFLKVGADVTQHRFGRQFSSLSSVLVGWTGHLSRQVTLAADAGESVFLHRTRSTYSAGSLGVIVEGHPSEQRVLRGTVGVRLSPAISPLAEAVTQAFRGEAAADLTDGRLRIAAFGSSGFAAAGIDNGARDVRFGASSAWVLTRTWTLEGGLRAAWTNQAPFAGWQSEAFVGLRWGSTGTL